MAIHKKFGNEKIINGKMVHTCLECGVGQLTFNQYRMATVTKGCYE